MTSLVKTAPTFSERDAERIASEVYSLQIRASRLPSERDQNFLLKDVNQNQVTHVLKIANSMESIEKLDMQNQLIRQLAKAETGLVFPRLIPDHNGEDISRIKSEHGDENFVRLFTWVDGIPLAKAKRHSCTLLKSLGHKLALVDKALTDFSHPAARLSFHWDLRNAGVARQYGELLPASRRAIVESFFGQWQEIDWIQLRFSVIHNDANDYNVLVSSSQEQVTSILDYGDVVYTATICDLAIALAYVMLDKADPIGAAAQVVAAYQEVYPLAAAEIDCLYTLAATRLCCSVCFAANQTQEAPDNQYLNISNEPAWELLEKLSNIPLEWTRRVFRYACGLPMVSNGLQGRGSEEIANSRKRHLGPSLSLSYRAPLHILHGSKQYLYDADGRRYLDCVNNVAHVGHSHPYVVRAAYEQMTRLNTNTRYLYEYLVQYVERLTSLLPEPLSIVYLVNSGSEANELALRLARAHSGHDDVIVVDHAYHGNTNAIIDLSPYKFDGPGGRGCTAYVHKVPMPDVYHGLHYGEDAGKCYAQYVAGTARELKDRDRGLAAFFCESAPSVGGQIILPPGYLREAYASVRAAGGVCVADEVQTGFGRPGETFWMFETQSVVPDIVTLGKPIGNGHPVAAVITSREIADSFNNGMEYFNTFGGNPVSCAVGLAVLDVIRNEELQGNALEVGNYLLNGLQQLKEKHALIGDIRGLGLFIGIELVRGHESLEPADREARELVERMKDSGVLLSVDGPLHNVIKIKPPIVFSRADSDFLLCTLDRVLPHVSRR